MTSDVKGGSPLLDQFASILSGLADGSLWQPRKTGLLFIKEGDQRMGLLGYNGDRAGQYLKERYVSSIEQLGWVVDESDCVVSEPRWEDLRDDALARTKEAASLWACECDERFVTMYLKGHWFVALTHEVVEANGEVVTEEVWRFRAPCTQCHRTHEFSYKDLDLLHGSETLRTVPTRHATFHILLPREVAMLVDYGLGEEVRHLGSTCPITGSSLPPQLHGQTVTIDTSTSSE